MYVFISVCVCLPTFKLPCQSECRKLNEKIITIFLAEENVMYPTGLCTSHKLTNLNMGFFRCCCCCCCSMFVMLVYHTFKITLKLFSYFALITFTLWVIFFAFRFIYCWMPANGFDYLSLFFSILQETAGSIWL